MAWVIIITTVAGGFLPLSGTAHASSLAVRSHSTGTSGSTSLTISKPSGTAENDVLVAMVIVDDDGDTASLSGWTVRVNTTNTAGAGDYRTLLFTKVAGASEPSSYTFTITDNEATFGSITAISGADI